MKSPLLPLFLLTFVVGIGLYGTISWFVRGTDDLASKLDVRSLAYVRNEVDEDANREPRPLAAEPMTDAEFAEPEPMVTLEELTRAEEEKLIAELVEQEEADEEAARNEEDEDKEDEESDEKEREDGEHEDIEGSSLSKEEREAREKARRDRLAALGLVQEEPPEPTVAVDVALVMPQECAGAAVAKVPAALKFRFETSRIRGESLNVLESLLSLYRQCEEGSFVVEENPLGRDDADDILAQMRLDEVKYFFLQHNVSLELVEFRSDND